MARKRAKRSEPPPQRFHEKLLLRQSMLSLPEVNDFGKRTREPSWRGDYLESCGWGQPCSEVGWSAGWPESCVSSDDWFSRSATIGTPGLAPVAWGGARAICRRQRQLEFPDFANPVIIVTPCLQGGCDGF